MADLTHLGGLQPVEQLDLGDVYPESRESKFQLPPKGRYTLQAPESFPPAAFTRTRAGSLLVQTDPTIVGPTNEGFTLRYTKESAKPFKRDGQAVSRIGDYLRATGFRGTLKNEQDIADAVEGTAGKVFEAEVDWRASNFRTGFQVEGMTRFPKNTDGTYQSWVEDPTEKDENGKPTRVRANLSITRYISAE